MAAKSKTALGRVEFKGGRPKTTCQGQGLNSRPRRKNNRKKLRGQGKG